ncbi:MAG TPA: serine hydrolase domain-containing protein [Rhodothermales bacterium]|nr:serine hydrolase domain-containing protein [Rhodothermales bacterium]
MDTPAWWQDVVDAVATYHHEHPDNLPGAVFGVETEADGTLIASVGAGWTHDTICEIGSMTKVFTATAILLALEAHDLLDLDRPVYQLPGMEVYAADPLKREIRIRHLLQHTAGLPNVQPYTDSPKALCNNPEGEPCTCRDEEDPDLGPTVPWTCYPGGTNECIYVGGRCRPARTLTLDQVSHYIMQVYAPMRQPGLEYAYSPLHYIVGARIVEHLSGQSLNRFLRDRLFDVVGMSNSFFIAQPPGDPRLDPWLDEGVTEAQRQRIPAVHLITRDGKMPPEVAPGPDGAWDNLRRGWRFVYPDGGMYATVGDLLRYLRLLRDGGYQGGRQVLSPEIVRLLVEDQGHGHTMGFGYRRQTTPYGQGAGTLEHFGSKMTYLWYDPHPEEALLGVFLSQRLPNVAVNNNMAEGMQVIFRVFVPKVKNAIYTVAPSSAST